MFDSFKLGNDYLADFNVGIGSDESGLLEEIFTPSIENIIDDSIMGIDGGYYFNQRFLPRVFSIKCFFTDVDENLRRDIQRIFTFKTPKKLILDRRPYKHINVLVNKQIDWRYVWQGDLSTGNLYSGFFTVEFIAIDPLWYSVFDSIGLPGYLEDINSHPDTLFYDSGMLYTEDMLSSALSNITSTKTFQLYNGGNYKSKCKITLLGSGTNIKISNLTTGKNLTLSSMTNETVIIDGCKGRIYDGTILKTSKFSGSFVTVESGYNDMQITGSGLNLSSVEFSYRYTYL